LPQGSSGIGQQGKEQAAFDVADAHPTKLPATSVVLHRGS
jgi:hypothetical protein